MDKAWKGKFGIGEYLLLSPIFPNLKEIDLACSRKWTLDEIWHIYEEPESEVSEIRPEHKILTLGQASEIFRKAESEEVRKGYVGGKWGLGAHREHLDLLSQAKAALGAGGKLIVGVESGEAIKDRRPGHHGIFSDAERLYRMAALSMVDAVVLLDPKPGQALEEYYLGIWRRLQPNIYFFGDKNYFWRPVLEKRAKETGVILLYARDANQITTTQLLEEITI
jgi:bifunctional ADP-heptose synthase (sugar kinase/adenylyltransferase)